MKKRNYRDKEIEKALGPVLERLRRQHYINWLARGMAVAVIIAVAFLLWSFLRPWPEVRDWCGGMGSGLVLLSLLAAFVTRPDNWQAACRVDGNGLQERVTTALELSSQGPTYISICQRRDTLKHLQAFDSRTKFPYLFPTRPGKVLLAAVMTVVLLSFLPNPQQVAVDKQVAVRQEIARQEKKVEQVKKEMQKKNSQGLVSEKSEEAINTLEELQKNLHEAKKEGEALKSLSQAKEQLGKSDSGDAGLKGDLDRLAQAWQAEAMTKPLGDKMAAGDAVGVKQEMKKITNKLDSMSAGERQVLANSLQSGASGMPAGKLAAGLNQAACGVGGT